MLTDHHSHVTTIVCIIAMCHYILMNSQHMNIKKWWISLENEQFIHEFDNRKVTNVSIYLLIQYSVYYWISPDSRGNDALYAITYPNPNLNPFRTRGKFSIDNFVANIGWSHKRFWLVKLNSSIEMMTNYGESMLSHVFTWLTGPDDWSANRTWDSGFLCTCGREPGYIQALVRKCTK